MNRRCIRSARDQTIKGINLAHQMTFAKASNRWIAGHRANGIAPKTDQGSARAHARCNRCSLCASMPAANDDNIEVAIRIHLVRALDDAHHSVKGRVSGYNLDLFHVKHHRFICRCKIVQTRYPACLPYWPDRSARQAPSEPAAIPRQQPTNQELLPHPATP